MIKTLLWLDDVRDPFGQEVNWTAFSPVPFDTVVWVKSYYEFCDYIKDKGVPYVICFDHDLGEDSNGYTGKDCANFLVDYCIEHHEQLPYFGSQSANPVGRENIINYLQQAKLFINK